MLLMGRIAVVIYIFEKEKLGNQWKSKRLMILGHVLRSMKQSMGKLPSHLTCTNQLNTSGNLHWNNSAQII